MERTSNNIFYKLNKYPLEKTTCKVRGELVIDRHGNIYKITNNLAKNKILDSPLVKFELVTNLTPIQYKLFRILIKNDSRFKQSK